MTNEHKRWVIVFLVALGLRLILFIAIGPWKDEVFESRVLSEDKVYHHIAINIIENHIFSSSESSPYDPNTLRTPLYPSFLALTYVIFGYRPYIAILFQLIMGAITSVLTYKIGRIFFHEKIAFIAGLFLAFDYSSIFYNNLLLTETLFTLLFAVHIYLLAKFLTADNKKALIYSSIFLGLATLCRPVSIYFFIFLIGIFFIHFRKTLRKGILRYVLLALFFLLVVTPWIVRNHIVSGNFLLSSQQEEVLRWHIPSLINRLQTLKAAPPYHMESVPDSNSNASDISDENQGISIIKDIMNSVLLDAKRYIINVLFFFIIPSGNPFPHVLGFQYHKWERGDLRSRPLWVVKTAMQKISGGHLFFIFFSVVYFGFLNATMCFGIYKAIREKKITVVILFISIIAYFAIATSAAFHGRFRVPIMPYIILLSSYSIIRLQERFRGFSLR